jgi:hypothetical protein
MAQSAPEERRGKSLQTQGCGGGFKWFEINVDMRR